MKLTREAIDKLFEECYDSINESEKEEFTKFIFSHFYFLICVLGNNNVEMDVLALDNFRISFAKNMQYEGLEYIQQFFKNIENHE